MSATSSLYLDQDATQQNGGRSVYDVCRVGTTEIVGRITLGEDDRWYIDGDDVNSWGQAVDAIRVVMMGANKPNG